MWTFAERLANPTRFLQLSGALLPWLWLAAALTLLAGLYWAAMAPPDYQHGHTVKIMFVHVPCAWLAMMIYAIVAASSFGLLVFRHPLADVSAKAAAPIGAAFTLLALVTGSLWGKPGWGAYWVWDARLTSVLILFLLYVGLIALRSAFDDDVLAGRLTAMLALVGIVMLPIIKYSVTWWSTLHQPSTNLTTTIDPSLRRPLLIMVAGFTILFLAMHLKAMRNEILRRRVRTLVLAEVQRATGRGRPQAAEQTL